MNAFPGGYKWTKSSTSQFQDALCHPVCKSLLNNFMNHEYDNEDSERAVPDFLNIINVAATKANIFRHKSSKKRKPNCKWFDSDLGVKRKILVSKGELLSKFPYDPIVRGSYYKCYREYNKLRKYKMRTFKQSILNSLDNLRDSDPKQYWKLINSLKESTDDSKGKLMTFQRRSDAHYVSLVLDVQSLGSSYIGPGYNHPEKHHATPQGLDSFPSIFSYPHSERPAQHWPNVVSLITNRPQDSKMICVHDKHEDTDPQYMSSNLSDNKDHEVYYRSEDNECIPYSNKYKEVATKYMENGEKTRNPGTPNLDEDTDINMKELEKEANEITKKKGKGDKPLLRRKSELPHDITMIKALDSHKRHDEYLPTNSEGNSATTT
ncbi:Hypothetical predicted protein [Mytilus galloprovincialis]|uniref:Uncharacterized protein n=1 Tax=Mytilus galloprovincialis TaxID=29158 RepID=A0A8B6HHU8_MYTGA|nr:Hypothetical predicted protein [Mytilus galloprovincialis]